MLFSLMSCVVLPYVRLPSVQRMKSPFCPVTNAGVAIFARWLRCTGARRSRGAAVVAPSHRA